MHSLRAFNKPTGFCLHLFYLISYNYPNKTLYIPMALNPVLKKYFEEPVNAGILNGHNCRGRDSSLGTGAVVNFYAFIEDGIIKGISFRALGCSHTIAASSYITVIGRGMDIFTAAALSDTHIERTLGKFPDDKKDSLRVALGALYSLISSYIQENLKQKDLTEHENTVAVAMSGGLDSAIAARILKEEGYDVLGITMKIIPDEDIPREKRVTSWMSSDICSARMVCGILGIPHFTIDIADKFGKKIIEPFCREYLRGRTPNPCIECNKIIKFGTLLDAGRNLGARYLATGHYCLVGKNPETGLYMVKKGKDRLKEQSYVFWKLDQGQLSRIKTPLGIYSKEEVREMSLDLLPFLESRDESQDICFIASRGYHEFLKKRIGETGKGKILDSSGSHIGDHRGFPYYTIGQRKGLGVSRARPLYVTRILPQENILIAGEKEELYQDTASLENVNFISGRPPAARFDARVKIRYNSPPLKAGVIMKKNNRAQVLFCRPASSVTPGQSAVFYEGDILLGGGVISG